jgi:hypothetical protein
MSGIQLSPYFWALAVTAVLPPLLLVLYFLKLKRRPLEVPSTYLWHRTIEDLHVNAIWQRLRQSLLLLLQLLFFGLIALALLGPAIQTRAQINDRLIFLVDTSASMSATDVGPSRLEQAKRECEQLIDAMGDESVAMIISFSDTARVEQTFTPNKNILRTKLRTIQPTTHPSQLDEALRAAAGLANPGRTGDASKGDVPAAAPMPAQLYVMSDGGFARIPEFALGVLDAKYIKVGDDAPENAAITGFSTDRNPETGRLQAFARIENFSARELSANVTLSVNGEFRDVQSVSLPGRGESVSAAGVEFELHDDDEGVLRLELDHKDQLPVDNVAYAVLNAPRPARVLVVTGSPSTGLRLALTTEEAQKIAQVEFVAPSHLESKKYADDAASGYYDLIIYDRCVPANPPQANTLFLGVVPPFEGWPAGEKQGSPAIIDIDRAHPLTQLVEMSNVLITQTLVVHKPKGGIELIEADVGPILAIGPRQSFEDAMLGFSIAAKGDDGEEKPITDWPRRKSFPVFIMNAVKYLGGAGGRTHFATVRPGGIYPIRTVLPVDHVTVKPPSGPALEVRREGLSAINFSQTDEIGVYEVREGSGTKLGQQFAVNLFDPRESDLKPAAVLPIGHERVQAEVSSGTQRSKIDLWKWVLIVGLVLVLFEWYVYNQRVYL